ncbi:hypothetical protein [Streptomyces sp. MP131-18]|uniref:hypothetical protein n=1 Tax=Streptomyces sp. MP131-18 TaxID=1857892 RepID=UPI00097C7360|nr:hypothetical protein [Streptomyces sp. MP131-18]ONK14204.1 hypothetical protein STBA_49840 [Streptomyces sp. MP131-18]
MDQILLVRKASFWMHSPAGADPVFASSAPYGREVSISRPPCSQKRRATSVMRPVPAPGRVSEVMKVLPRPMAGSRSPVRGTSLRIKSRSAAVAAVAVAPVAAVTDVAPARPPRTRSDCRRVVHGVLPPLADGS